MIFKKLTCDKLVYRMSRNREEFVVLVAIVGFAALLPTISAIKSGKKIALANKETLVVAGQIISSLVLSLRKKEMIKVRQPLQRVMVPVLDPSVKEQILAVADLIKSEVNVKEVELIDDASGILVKQVKPNFRVLGPRFGKEM